MLTSLFCDRFAHNFICNRLIYKTLFFLILNIRSRLSEACVSAFEFVQDLEIRD